MSELKDTGIVWYKDCMGTFASIRKMFGQMLKNAEKGNFKDDEQNFLTLSRTMSEKYTEDIVPFQKFLESKGINDATVARTGDTTGHQLLGWLKEMTNEHRELIKLANQLGRFK